MTIEEELVPQTIEFWGASYKNFHPELFSKTFGDGKRLLRIQCLNTRPWYFIIKVDSQYPSNEDEETEFLDEVLNELEDEFGNERDRDSAFPVVNIDAGYHWEFEEYDATCIPSLS